MTSRLIGTWHLVSWEFRLTSGVTRYPFGRDAIGQLIYSADGYMSVSLMAANRASFASSGLLDGTTSEKASAAEGYASYAGRYEVQPGKVLHVVEMSLFPNWVGTVQERLLEFDGDHLVLSTEPFIENGEEQVAYAIWRKRTLPP